MASRRIGSVTEAFAVGSSWVVQPAAGGALRGVHFLDINTGYAVGNNGNTLKTTDGGSTWVPQTTPTTEHLHDVHFPVDATTGWVVGDNDVVLKTSYGGSTWVPQTTPTNVRMEGVWFDDNLVGWAVGDNGEGIPADLEDRLFQRYIHQGRQPLVLGSVGLGLSIVRALGEGMGGAVSYERGRGWTRFLLTLPLVAEVGNETAAAARYPHLEPDADEPERYDVGATRQETRARPEMP